jgi:hypothetical protein
VAAVVFALVKVVGGWGWLCFEVIRDWKEMSVVVLEKDVCLIPPM